eukprot:10427812-Lingulodinium_polyedra.AAC.1
MARSAKFRGSPVRPARCCCAVRGGRVAARADSRSADGVARPRVGRGAEALVGEAVWPGPGASSVVSGLAAASSSELISSSPGAVAGPHGDSLAAMPVRHGVGEGRPPGRAAGEGAQTALQ